MDEETIVTLIGTKLAKVGNEFIFRGGAKDCEGCKLHKTCLNLNIGSKYRITHVRNTGEFDCFVHDSGVCAVEVVEAPIKMAIESRKAIQGSKLVYEQECEESDCEHYTLCFPPGLKKYEKFTIVDVGDEVIDSCEKGKILKVVEVKRCEE